MSINAARTTVLSGSGLATSSVQPHSAVLSLAPDVDPADSRDPEGICSPLPDETADEEPRGAEADPPSPKKGVGDAEGGEGITADSMKAGLSRELSVKFTTPPPQRKGGHSPTLQELLGWTSWFFFRSTCFHSVLPFVDCFVVLGFLLLFFSLFSVQVFVIASLCVGGGESFAAVSDGTPLSPGDLAQFGCHLIAQVENRTVQSIEAGMLAFCAVRLLIGSFC